MSWTAVAKKEFLENVRNYWIIAITVVFLVLVLVSSAVVGAFSSVGSNAPARLASIDATITTMRFVGGFLLPIIALMLGFGTLAGERESGSLGLLIAQPVTRAQILLGKFVGLYAVLASAILVGLGGSALIVLANAPSSPNAMNHLILFLVITLAWAGAWLSLTLLVSAYFQRRGTAIAGSLLAWFIMSIVWLPLTILLVVAAGARVASAPGARPSAPSWLNVMELLNPDAVYGGLLAKSIGGLAGVVGQLLEAVVPSQPSTATFVVAMAAWIVVPLAGAYWLFANKDV